MRYFLSFFLSFSFPKGLLFPSIGRTIVSLSILHAMKWCHLKFSFKTHVMEPSGVLRGV